MTKVPAIDGCTLDDFVYYFTNASSVVCIREFRVEEDLWAQEPLVAHIHFEALLVHRVHALVHFEALRGVTVEPVNYTVHEQFNSNAPY